MYVTVFRSTGNYPVHQLAFCYIHWVYDKKYEAAFG